MGPGNKSLVNLPVTQLLTVMTSEPLRPQRGKQKNGRDFCIVSNFPAGARECRQPHLPHVACPHCGSFRIKLQNTSKSGFPGSRKWGKMCRQMAEPEGWDRPTNHSCCRQRVFFVGDWNLLAMCRLKFFTLLLSLFLFLSPLFLFGLMG